MATTHTILPVAAHMRDHDCPPKVSTGSGDGSYNEKHADTGGTLSQLAMATLPDFEINPPTDRSMRDVFSKYIDVFGVGIAATDSVSDSKVRHAAIVMAEYLDNDEDG